MKIVFLDHEVIDRGDIDWGKVKALGELTIYPHTASDDEAIARLKEANLWLRDDKLTNKGNKTYKVIIP